MEYEEAVNLISEIEAASDKQTSIIIDVNQVLANKLDIVKYDYQRADAIINSIENVRTSEPATDLKQKQVMEEAQKPQAPQPIKRENPTEPMGKEIANAASEVKNLVGKLGGDFERNIGVSMHRPNTKKLVLPNLSLQDQISELEKISLGIDGNAFSKQQLNIVREEVDAVNISVKMEKPPVDSFQIGLTELRNQRLKEVVGKLK